MILGVNGIPETCNWLECTMETDASIHDHMSTNEMYMVLQTDMVNIKQQEQALQTEIVSIKNKFLNLLQHCGLENEFTFTPHHVTMATAADGPTTSTSDHSTCNLHYSYADFLIEQLLASASGLTDSDLSPSPEETRNELDTSVPVADQVEVHNSLSSPSNGVGNSNYNNSHMSQVLQEANIKVVPNQLDSTTSENCVPSSASSDSYPPSSSEDFSDNQVVPDLDLEKELISRVKYYSDFTIDRQRKINELLNKSKNLCLSKCRPSVFPGGSNISERTVEGAESKPHCVQRISVRPSFKAPSSSASSGGATTSSSSSNYYQSKSKNKTSSSRSSRTSSHPLMSSTLIYQPTSNLPSSSTSGESVYTWSIDENSEPGNLEQSYFRSRHRNQHKNRKQNVSRCSSRRHRQRQQMQSSAMHLTGLVSIIEPATCVKDDCTRNMCTDVDCGYKAQTLPRTSTRINLFAAADSSFSMPNMNGQPSSDSSSPLHERTDLPGKSSTSEGSTYVTNFGSSTLTSMMVAPNVTECSRFTTDVDSSIIDSILTDSPKSVDSSGIFAPYNSPHATSISSQCGYTTVSSSIPSTSSNDCCDYRGPLPTPATVKPSDSIFKIPHSPIARSKLCSKRNSSRSPSVRTSTPRPFHSVTGSAHSIPVMRRKLFELNNNGQKTGEPRILDKKAIVRKFKKFSHHFKKDHTDKIKTLANL